MIFAARPRGGPTAASASWALCKGVTSKVMQRQFNAETVKNAEFKKICVHPCSSVVSSLLFLLDPQRPLRLKTVFVTFVQFVAKHLSRHRGYYGRKHDPGAPAKGIPSGVVAVRECGERRRKEESFDLFYVAFRHAPLQSRFRPYLNIALFLVNDN